MLTKDPSDEEFERCGCLGQRSDPAAVGSPLLGLCEQNQVQSDFCHYHVMAFAGMVRPLVKWVAQVLSKL